MDLDNYFKIKKSFISFPSISPSKKTATKELIENLENSELSREDFILQLLNPNYKGNSGQKTEKESTTKKQQTNEDFILELLSQNSSVCSKSTSLILHDSFPEVQEVECTSQTCYEHINKKAKTNLNNTCDNLIKIESQSTNNSTNSQKSTVYEIVDDEFDENTSIKQNLNDKRSLNSRNNIFNDNKFTNDLFSELFSSDEEDFTPRKHKTLNNSSLEMKMNKTQNFEYKSSPEESQISNRSVMKDVINNPINTKINEMNIFNEDYILKTISSQIDFSQTYQNKENASTSTEYMNKPYIKRYRKGNTRIFRLKRRESVETNRLSCITDDSKSECLSVYSAADLTQTELKLKESINTMRKDKSLLFNLEKNGIPIEPKKEDILMKITEILINILQCLNRKINPVLKIPRVTYDNCIFKDNRLQMKDIKDAKLTKIVYNNKRSHDKFCVIVHILQKVKHLLETNTKLTKREIFYQIKHLIKNQYSSNAAISTICYMLNVGQWSLNIIGGSGLVYGNLKLQMIGGYEINCKIPGTRIPHDLSTISEIVSDAKFILVIEKEAMFYKLLEDLPDQIPYPFILITGKGFPDISTRFFLNKLRMILAIPVFILVDADVYGIKIMITYKFGSLSNSHISHYLAVPEAVWLGVFPSEIMKLEISHLPLTDTDRNIIKKLLKSPYVTNNQKLTEELNIMLRKNYKAEIEGLIRNSTFLSDSYLLSKIRISSCIP